MQLHSLIQGLSLVGTMALLGACGGSGGGSSETGTLTATTSTSTGATSTTTVTGSSGGTGSSGEPTTGGSVGQTDSTGGTTTSPVTTTQGTSGTSGSTGSTGSSSDGTSGGESTGGPVEVGMPCKSAKDCQLADGCCFCEPLNPGETVPECDIPECLQTTCAAQNLEQVPLECRWGVCAFEKQTCNPLGVVCKSLPPDCAPGDVPGVAGDCWSGACVPAEACDWVPDCSYCDAPDLVCVFKAQKGAYHVCEPRPLDCGPGDIDCGCGQQICDASPPHTVCSDADPGIVCECPFC